MELSISDMATQAEVEQLPDLRQLKGPVAPKSIVAFAEAIGRGLLPLNAAHATAGLAQPLGYKDPVNKLLLIQAQAEGMRQLTRDAKLIGHPFAVTGEPG